MWHLAIGVLFLTKPSLVMIFAFLSLPSASEPRLA
jgi:hypothetical protein